MLDICRPRYATARTESRETLGGRASRYADKLGYPLMAWQQLVCDVSLEIDPRTGKLAYQFIDITVPRQNGKTTLLEVLVLLRGLGFSSDAQQMVYAAQNRNAAVKKVFDDWRPVLEASPFDPYLKFRAGNGKEQLQLRGGSTMDIEASEKSSGQGRSFDKVIVDEAFDFKDDRMDNNLIPTMRTRAARSPQMWVVSTAGTPKDSPWLLGKVKKGRQATLDGVNTKHAYFEWSAPDEDDPSDPRTWARCTPAMGLTVDEAGIAMEYQATELSSFRRFALNQWVESMVDPVLPLATWDALDIETPAERVGSWAIAFEVSEDREWGTVAAASRRADGKILVEVRKRQHGTGWMVDYIKDIWHQRRPVGIWCDRSGPGGSLITDLETANVPLVEDVATSALAKACGLWYDGCLRTPDDGGPELYHYHDDILREALNGGHKRSTGDSWVFNRKTSPADVSPLIAVVMAFYGIKQHSRAPVVHDLSEIIARKKREAAGDKTGPVTPVGDDVPAPKRSGKGSFTPL